MGWSVWATAAIGGLLIGSFLNVVIYRGPVHWGLIDSPEPRGSLWGPRSYCPDCRIPIPYRFLIPLIGFILARRRCHYCKAPIAWRYAIVELLGATVGALAVIGWGVSMSALIAALFGFGLMALAFIDWDTGFLPDRITVPLIVLGVAAAASGQFVPFQIAVLGAVLGYAAFFCIELAYEKWRGRAGLGRGDAKLLAAIGAFVGAYKLPIVVFIGAAVTLLVIGAVRLTTALGETARADPSDAAERELAEEIIPFGPGLAFAGYLVFLFGLW